MSIAWLFYKSIYANHLSIYVYVALPPIYICNAYPSSMYTCSVRYTLAHYDFCSSCLLPIGLYMFNLPSLHQFTHLHVLAIHTAYANIVWSLFNYKDLVAFNYYHTWKNAPFVVTVHFSYTCGFVSYGNSSRFVLPAIKASNNISVHIFILGQPSCICIPLSYSNQSLPMCVCVCNVI